MSRHTRPTAFECDNKAKHIHLDNQNPYTPPTNTESDIDVSPWTRTRLFEAIVDAVASLPNTDPFDEICFDPQLETTKDAIIAMVLEELHTHVIPDQLLSSKQQWDLVQRYLLVLQVEYDLQVVHRTDWSKSQLLGIPVIACIITTAAVWSGWAAYIVCAILMSTCWILQSAADRWFPPSKHENAHCHPFESMAAVAAAVRSTNFRKQRYTFEPAPAAQKSVWSRLAQCIFCTLFSPLLLVGMMLPDVVSVVRIASHKTVKTTD